MSTKVTIKEHSFIAKIAAWKLKQPKMAVTIGRKIHLYHVSKKDFLQDKKWLCHELKHVQQYQEHGYISFILQYLWESFRKGYHHNKFEVAARRAALQPELINEFDIS